MLQSIGDLARNVALRSQSAQLKTQQSSLMSELASGQTSNVPKRLNGQTTQVAAIERDLKFHSAFLGNIQETMTRAKVMQTSFDVVDAASNDLTQTLIIGPQSNLAQVAMLARNQAQATAGSVFSALNARTAGDYVFSGDQTDAPPFANPDAFFDQIDGALMGLSDANAIETAVGKFFSSGGSFDTLIYQGGANPRSAASIDKSETAAVSAQGNNAPYREILEAAALAYAASFASSSAQRNDLLSTAREMLLSANAGLASERGRIGFAQEQLERAMVRHQVQVSELEITRSDLLSVDSFDVATRLEEANNRIEMLYAVTARSARLSFLEYMR